jgi:hypothetical protein
VSVHGISHIAGSDAAVYSTLKLRDSPVHAFILNAFKLKLENFMRGLLLKTLAKKICCESFLGNIKPAFFASGGDNFNYCAVLLGRISVSL